MVSDERLKNEAANAIADTGSDSDRYVITRTDDLAVSSHRNYLRSSSKNIEFCT
jgi:hypothetical protein